MGGTEKRRKQLEIYLDGKKLKQGGSFVYLERCVGMGISTPKLRRRMRAGANAWRKVEGAMRDRCISYYHKFSTLPVHFWLCF